MRGRLRHPAYREILACMGLIVLAGNGASGAGKTPYLHAAFDNDCRATVAGKAVAPLGEASYAYEDGPVGKAVIVAEQALRYKEADDFPLKQGTVAFWVKPHWDTANKAHWVLQKWPKWDRSPVNGLWFLLGGFGGGQHLGAGLSNGRNGGGTLMWFYERETPATEWRANEWKHVALTWSDEGRGLYINGCMVDRDDQACSPEEHAAEIILSGKHNYYSGPTSLDDFRVYDAALTPDEIEALFLMGDRKLAGAPPARQGVLAEYTASREFDRLFREAYRKRHGKAASAVDLAVSMNADFEACLRQLSKPKPEFVAALRRSFAQASKSLCAVPRAERKPVCDGNVTADDWARAARLKGFVLHKSTQPAWRDTTVRLCHDGEYLYVAATCYEDRGDKVIATLTRHDDPMWKNDAIEFLFQAVPDDKQYLQFVLNPSGACFDMASGDASWNSTITAGAVVEDACAQWSVEAAIPFSDLGITPAPGTLLRANFSRDNVGGKALNDKGGATFEASAWAPVPNRLNDPRSFGILVLE